MSRNEEDNRLGKGLSSLLGDRKNFSIIRKDNDIGNELNIDLITTNCNQPRKNFDDESMNELVQSIKKYGVLQPILVRKNGDGKYEIIAGERRFRSAKIAGLKTIPVVIRNFSDKDAFSLSIIENIQRENLNSIEEASAYKELVDKYGYTQQEIAEIVNKSRSHIANMLRLLTLPEIVQKSLIDGKIDMGHAKALINCDFAEDIIDYIVENELTVRDVEKIVKEGENIGDIKISPKREVNRRKFYIGEDRERRIAYLKAKFFLDFSINYDKRSKTYNFNVKASSLNELDGFINKL